MEPNFAAKSSVLQATPYTGSHNITLQTTVEWIGRAYACYTSRGVINKLTKSKQGVWHEITKLALYFMRMTPSSSTGFSPYMMVHGWEPASPLEVVKEGLLDENMDDIDITSWVRENMERVELVSDHIVKNQTRVTKNRKKLRDKYSKERTFTPGTQVLYRTPGINAKLTDAWEGTL